MLRWLRPASIVATAVIVLTLVIIQPWNSDTQNVFAKASEAMSQPQSYRTTLLLTTNFESQTMEYSFAAAYASDNRYHVTITFNDASAEFIRIGGKLYRHDISDTEPIHYSSPSILAKEGTIEMLGWLTNVESLPNVDIDGTDCLHYRGEFDLERMISELRTAGQTTEAEILEQWQDTITEFELWIGKDDYLIRKMVQEMRSPVRTPSGDIEYWNINKSEARFYDFNVPIVIDPPLTASGELLPGWELVPSEPDLIPTPSKEPEILHDFEPTQHWQIQADGEQLETIEDLWGKDIGYIELLQTICPEVMQDVPQPLLRDQGKVIWPSQNLNWNLPVTSFGPVVSVIYLKESNDQITVTETYQLYYFIGKESEEMLHRDIMIQPGEIYELYAVSIYTGY